MNRKAFTTLAAFALLAVISVYAAAQTAPSDWKRYTVKGEEFSVLLPHLPAMTSSKMVVPRLQNGQPVFKKRMERVLVASADGITYTVYAYENPKPRQTLDEFIAQQKRKFPPVTEQSDRERFFAGDEHFYKFVATGGSADNVKVAQFFASIVVSKNREGIEVVDGPGIPLQSAVVVEKAYVGKEVDTKVRLLKKPEPVYTEAARNNGVTGVVVLKAIFSSAGIVTNVIIVQSLPDGLTERAIAAAKKIKFVPATKDGKNVSMWIQLEYNFNLK